MDSLSTNLQQKTVENPYAVFDYKDFPIVHILFTGTKATDENFTAYLEETNRIYEKGNYLAIIDASRPTYLAAKYRIMQGSALIENKERLEKFNLGLAIIAPSKLQRIVLDAIFLIKSYPSALKICKSEKEALGWAEEILGIEKLGKEESYGK